MAFVNKGKQTLTAQKSSFLQKSITTAKIITKIKFGTKNKILSFIKISAQRIMQKKVKEKLIFFAPFI